MSESPNSDHPRRPGAVDPVVLRKPRRIQHRKLRPHLCGKWKEPPKKSRKKKNKKHQKRKRKPS